MRKVSAMLAVLAVGGLSMVTTQQAASAAPGDELAKPMPVKDALVKLGARADAVARAHGRSEADWREKAKDPSAWIDRGGELFYMDPVNAAGAGSNTPAKAAALPYSETFLLHSKPTATRKLFLDFDGHVATATAWSAGTLTAASFTLDSDATTFTTAEQDVVQEVWQRVADDYAPFDIDVTTQDPGYAGLNRASTADVSFGTRVVITGTTAVYNTVCPGGCGGVAYVGSIDNTGTNHDKYQPAWVFTNGVGSGAKNIAEAAAHEAGHNVGLSHDGTATTGYYNGQGAWAPIMGVGYYKPVTQWSGGEYTGANNKQDDFAVIQSNAVPLRADDYGSLAVPSVAGLSPVSIAGVISTRTDVDGFQFTASAGTVSFTATSAAVGGNLDIKLDLVDAAGTVVATANPAVAMTSAGVATGLNATLTATVASGTYRIVVDGTGDGSPTATGYSDYGSTGAYTLTGSYPMSGVNQIPVASATATPGTGTAPVTVTYSGTGSRDIDGTIASYLWTFADGTTAAGATVTKQYTAGGTFATTLNVTDNGGATAATSVGVTLAAPLAVKILTSGVNLAGQTAAKGVKTYYAVDVPAGKAKLTLQISGGSGDADMYTRFGAAPTMSSYSCRPYLVGNYETCTVTNPAAGRWYVMLNAYSAYSGLNVKATAS